MKCSKWPPEAFPAVTPVTNIALSASHRLFCSPLAPSPPEESKYPCFPNTDTFPTSINKYKRPEYSLTFTEKWNTIEDKIVSRPKSTPSSLLTLGKTAALGFFSPHYTGVPCNWRPPEGACRLVIMYQLYGIIHMVSMYIQFL